MLLSAKGARHLLPLLPDQDDGLSDRGHRGLACKNKKEKGDVGLTCAIQCDARDRISPEMISEKRAFPEISRKWKIIRVWKICPILDLNQVI